MAHKIPIDWQSIQTVFLDMDGTLLDLHFDNHFWLEHLPKRYAEKHNMPYAKARDILMQHSDATQGTLDWYCLDHWSETFKIDIVSLKHEVSNKITIRENVISFLHQLKVMKKRIVLLTNAHIDSVTLKFSYVEMEHYFDEIITSHDIGLAKEQKGFWEALTKYENFDRTQCLFIDDNCDVLANADEFGIKHLFSITKPDSNKSAKKCKNHIAIADFQQLMINLND